MTITKGVGEPESSSRREIKSQITTHIDAIYTKGQRVVTTTKARRPINSDIRETKHSTTLTATGAGASHKSDSSETKIQRTLRETKAGAPSNSDSKGIRQRV